MTMASKPETTKPETTKSELMTKIYSQASNDFVIGDLRKERSKGSKAITLLKARLSLKAVLTLLLVRQIKQRAILNGRSLKLAQNSLKR